MQKIDYLQFLLLSIGITILLCCDLYAVQSLSDMADSGMPAGRPACLRQPFDDGTNSTYKRTGLLVVQNSVLTMCARIGKISLDIWLIVVVTDAIERFSIVYQFASTLLAFNRGKKEKND